MFKKAKHHFYSLIIFPLAIFSLAFAQQPKMMHEYALIHLAKTGYVTEELMWFKVYVLSVKEGRLSPVSKIAYIEVLQENGIPVHQQKIEIEHGMGDGCWSIPSTLATGKYAVRVYVAEQKAAAASIFSTPVQVVNPALPSPLTIVVHDSSRSAHNSYAQSFKGAGSDGFSIEGLQEKYPTRSQVKFNLNNPLTSANLSVGVYKNDGLELGYQKEVDLTAAMVKQVAFEVIKSNADAKVSPVEYNGHFITATVLDKVSGKPIKGVKVYLSVSGERFYFGKAVSDENGLVRFDAGKPYGTQQIVVQLPEPKDTNALVQLHSPYAGANAIEKEDATVSFKGLSSALDNRVFYATIDKSFEENSTTTYYLPHFNDSIVFYGTPDKTYYLDDYTRFNTMEEVLREYVVEVDLRKTNQQYKFSVLDIPNKKSFDKNPLVLIDGVPTSDINKVVAFDPLKVKRLDIVSRKFFLGDQSYDGIVSFITYGGDMGGFELDRQTLLVDYPGLLMKRQFNKIEYTTPEMSQSKLPDLRVLLHWEPNVSLIKNQPYPVSLFTPDLTGDYIIEIRGIAENGRQILQQHYFSVVK